MAQKKYVGVNGLSIFLENLKNTFAPKAHEHKLSEISDYKVDTALSATSENPVANNVLNEEFDAIAEAMNALESAIDDTNKDVSVNYDESIIGLSIDGQTITYIKGDGSVHTMVTQDNNTEYFLATDEVTGLTKLYSTTGNAEDGTMTQKAIKTELDKKVGVEVDDSQNALVFTV